MRRAVIVDDEMKSIEVLKSLVEHFIEGVEIVGTANDISSAVAVIEQTKPDLAFLDITLKEGDSFQILKQLKTIDFDVVFITAYDEYTTRALRYSGIHCLYKPIDISEFEKTLADLQNQNEQTGEAIEIARQLLQSKFTRIPVVTERGLKYIAPEQINYVETMGQSSILHFTDYTNLHTTKTLKELREVLENNHFITIHEEVLINLKNISVEKTKPGKLIFDSGEELRLEAEEVIKILKALGY